MVNPVFSEIKDCIFLKWKKMGKTRVNDPLGLPNE
jgi:hypothetical protein